MIWLDGQVGIIHHPINHSSINQLPWKAHSENFKCHRPGMIDFCCPHEPPMSLAPSLQAKPGASHIPFFPKERPKEEMLFGIFCHVTEACIWSCLMQTEPRSNQALTGRFHHAVQAVRSSAGGKRIERHGQSITTQSITMAFARAQGCTDIAHNHLAVHWLPR